MSLSVFGMAFMLYSTVLNPNFVTTEVEKIDIPALFREIVEEQIGDQLPAEMLFVKEEIYNVIDEEEQYLKQQANAAIYSGYNYFLGKNEQLDILMSIKPLKEKLRDNLWQTFREYLSSDLSELPEEIVKPFIYQYYNVLIDQLPEETFPRELLELPEDQVRLYLDQFYNEFVALLPEIYLPPEVVSMIEKTLEPMFNEYFDAYVEQIPDELVLNKSTITTDAMEQIIMVRTYIGYFKTGFYVLIGFIVLLIAGIILIHRNVKDSTRTLGIDLLFYGILEFAAVYLAGKYLPPLFPLSQIPATLHPWVIEVYNDLLVPLRIFSLGVLILGALLLIFSFVYKRRPTEDY
jgi:hypothetical protein